MNLDTLKMLVGTLTLQNLELNERVQVLERSLASAREREAALLLNAPFSMEKFEETVPSPSVAAGAEPGS